MNPRTPKRRRAVKEPQEAPFFALAMGLIVGMLIGVAGDRILEGSQKEAKHGWEKILPAAGAFPAPSTNLTESGGETLAAGNALASSPTVERGLNPHSVANLSSADQPSATIRNRLATSGSTPEPSITGDMGRVKVGHKAGDKTVRTAQFIKAGSEPGKPSCKVGKVAASDSAKAEPSRAHLISNTGVRITVIRAGRNRDGGSIPSSRAISPRLNPGKGMGAFGELQHDRGIDSK